MSETAKHTAAPWTFAKTAEQEPTAPDIWAVHASDPSHEATLCELWSGEHDNEANARLIAGAPELLAACIAALPKLGADANREVSDMVAAAIKKATQP